MPAHAAHINIEPEYLFSIDCWFISGIKEMKYKAKCG